jgi:MATE family multidrug resistance protein
VFVPLAHILIFAPGQGWIGFLPHLGYGALGGWTAVVVYVLTVAVSLLVRWRSKKWQLIHIQ